MLPRPAVVHRVLACVVIAAHLATPALTLAAETQSPPKQTAAKPPSTASGSSVTTNPIPTPWTIPPPEPEVKLEPVKPGPRGERNPNQAEAVPDPRRVEYDTNTHAAISTVAIRRPDCLADNYLKTQLLLSAGINTSSLEGTPADSVPAGGHRRGRLRQLLPTLLRPGAQRRRAHRRRRLVLELDAMGVERPRPGLAGRAPGVLRVGDPAPEVGPSLPSGPLVLCARPRRPSRRGPRAAPARAQRRAPDPSLRVVLRSPLRRLQRGGRAGQSGAAVVHRHVEPVPGDSAGVRRVLGHRPVLRTDRDHGIHRDAGAGGVHQPPLPHRRHHVRRAPHRGAAAHRGAARSRSTWSPRSATARRRRTTSSTTRPCATPTSRTGSRPRRRASPSSAKASS